jgi:hypothetical protein
MVFGLLRGHTSIEAASRELLAISMRLQREYPRANTGVIASPIPLREQFVGRTRPAILVLAVGVLAILLTTCANIAGLMIARSTTRARDVVIKTALGASRLALCREYFGRAFCFRSPARRFACWWPLIVCHCSVSWCRLVLPRGTPGSGQYFGRQASDSLSACVFLWQHCAAIRKRRVLFQDD